MLQAAQNTLNELRGWKYNNGINYREQQALIGQGNIMWANTMQLQGAYDSAIKDDWEAYQQGLGLYELSRQAQGGSRSAAEAIRTTMARLAGEKRGCFRSVAVFWSMTRGVETQHMDRLS